MRLAERAFAIAVGAALAAAVLISFAQAPGSAPPGATPPRDIVKPPPSSPAAASSAGAVVIEYKMELLDKDHDDHVSRAEAQGVPALIKDFDSFDASRDGRLDRIELEAAQKGLPR
jgi:hypothetical protein